MGFISARLDFDFTFTQDGDNDFGGSSFAPEFRKTLKFGAGITDGNADLAFIDHRTIAASGTDDLDLAGVLVDAFNNVITSAELVGVLITADTTNTNAVLVGGGTTPFDGMWGAAGDIIKVFPGGLFVNIAPNAAGLGATAAGASDILRIANGGADTEVGYSIALLARTA